MDNLETGKWRHLLPELPYPHAALEPHVDVKTMKLHHDKHHASYVANLNKALEDYPALHGHNALWLLLNLSAVPQKVRTAVHNNVGGHINHSLFWQAMCPAAGGVPAGALLAAIDHDFGSLDQFKVKFAEAGSALFGSGWVWLVRAAKQHGGRLKVCTTSGHDNPLMEGQFPILVNDVWEHAYYLKYENLRADYLKAWWSVTNWDEASRRFELAEDAAAISEPRQVLSLKK